MSIECGAGARWVFGARPVRATEARPPSNAPGPLGAEEAAMSRRRRAFTLVELLVVIGVIAGLIAILMPALNKARAQARMVACQSNMRQIGVALTMYATQHKGRPL